MTVDEMRMELQTYCDDRENCNGCPIRAIGDCDDGGHYYFVDYGHRYHEVYSDEKIVKMYEALMMPKEGKRMTTEEKRKKLEEYCNVRSTCKGCPVRVLKKCNTEDHYEFVNHHGARIPYSDDVIDHMYAAAFLGKKYPSETVDHPDHYYRGDRECIDVMRLMFGDEAVKWFCRLNAFKYEWRADMKNGDEDHEKAEWYLKYIEQMEGRK